MNICFISERVNVLCCQVRNVVFLISVTDICVCVCDNNNNNYYYVQIKHFYEWLFGLIKVVSKSLWVLHFGSVPEILHIRQQLYHWTISHLLMYIKFYLMELTTLY